MEYQVIFPTAVKDGKYGGKWHEFNVTIIVDGEEITGKCNIGIPKKDGFRFCVVTITNGVAIVKAAI